MADYEEVKKGRIYRGKTQTVDMAGASFKRKPVAHVRDVIAYGTGYTVIYLDEKGSHKMGLQEFMKTYPQELL